MFNRTIWDHVELWPTYLWPCLATAIMFNLWDFNTKLRAQGILHLDLYKSAGTKFLFGSVYALSVILVPALEIYTVIIMGWWFLIAGACVTLLLIAITRPMVGFCPYSQYISPTVFIAVCLSYAVLLGLVQIDVVAQINLQIFSWLYIAGRVNVALTMFGLVIAAKILPIVYLKILSSMPARNTPARR